MAMITSIEEVTSDARHASSRSHVMMPILGQSLCHAECRITRESAHLKSGEHPKADEHRKESPSTRRI